jgi:hypothetical protein
MMAATARPVGAAVSIPSRKARATGFRAHRISNGASDFSDRATEPIDGGDDNSVASTGVVEHGRQSRTGSFGRAGELVGKDSFCVDADAGERGQLRSRSWPVVLTRA